MDNSVSNKLAEPTQSHDITVIDQQWRDGQLKYEALVVLAGGTLAREKGNHVLLAEWVYEIDSLRERQNSRSGGFTSSPGYVGPSGTPQAQTNARAEWNQESQFLASEISRLRVEAEKLRGEFKLWIGTNNKSPANSSQGRELLQRASKRLASLSDAGRTVIQQRLTTGSFSDFFKCLSDAHQKLLIDADERFAQPALPTTKSGSIERSIDVVRDISVHRNHTFKKPTINSKSVDQRFYFLDPHSAHNWRDVISKGKYDQYKHCVESLELFLGRKDRRNEPSQFSKIWQDFLQGGTVDGAVMLGGGGLEKDVHVIESILKHAPLKDVHYSIVDVSIYMLMDSVSTLEEQPDLLTAPERVQIHPLIWDFTDLAGAKRRLVPNGKNVGWFLPGGTIGNLIETDFLASMKNVATPGDLLVIGMETWGEREENFYEEVEQFKAKYRAPELNTFLKIPLRAVWDELKLTSSLSNSLEGKAVNAIPDKPGYPNRYSDIHESITVEISIEKSAAAGSGKFVLLTSTRYKEEKFIEAARVPGFEHLVSVPAPTNSNYKQLVFRFDPR